MLQTREECAILKKTTVPGVDPEPVHATQHKIYSKYQEAQKMRNTQAKRETIQVDIHTLLVPRKER